MNRLQRYLLRELLTAFVLLLLIISGIVAASLMLRFLHRAPELGLVALVRALPFVLPEAFPITLPLAFLVACLLTFGRFADDNEFTAMRMAGIHPWLAVAPAVLVGIVLSFGTLWLNTEVLPWATLGKKEILRDQIQVLIRALEQGNSTEITIGDSFRMSASGRQPDGGFVDVYITFETTDEDERGETAPERIEIRAEKAWLWLDTPGDTLVMELEEAESTVNRMRVHQAGQTLAISLDRLVGASQRERTKRETQMTAEELLYRQSRGSPNEQLEREWAAEYWGRIALGLAPLVFGLVGAPLGLATGRSSRAAALVIALVVALPVYYPLVRLGEALAQQGTLPPPLAMFLGNLLLAGAGLFLLRRVVYAR